MQKEVPVVIRKLRELQRRSIAGLSIASMRTPCKLGASPPQAGLKSHLTEHNSESQISFALLIQGPLAKVSGRKRNRGILCTKD